MFNLLRDLPEIESQYVPVSDETVQGLKDKVLDLIKVYRDTVKLVDYDCNRNYKLGEFLQSHLPEATVGGGFHYSSIYVAFPHGTGEIRLTFSIE